MGTDDLSTELLKTVKSAIEKYRMIPRDSGVVIGVSGGPDSVALLHIIHRLSSELSFRIVVAHLEHGLRDQAPIDADFVRKMSEGLGVDFRLGNANVRKCALREGTSVEEAGRKLRYRFFEKTRLKLNADVIATAHHVDDELETFFLRILRGSSLKGLCGIPPVRGRIVRPLIQVQRDRIREFLEAESIPYRTDETNLKPHTDRNFVRNKLIPTIAERFPGFHKTMERTIRHLGEQERYLSEISSELCADAIAFEDDELVMQLEKVKTMDKVPVTRSIMEGLYQISGPDVRWAKSHIDLIMKVANSRSASAQAFLPGGLRARREYGRVRISRTGAKPPADPFFVTVEGPCTVAIPGNPSRLHFRIMDYVGVPEGLQATSAEAYFDADEARFPLTVRPWRTGDRFHAWGAPGTCKLKKLMIDVKAPLHLRRTLPLVLKGNEIIWVPGIRRGRAAPVTGATRRVLEVCMAEVK